MGFVVLPALVPDISAVYDVYFAAFKDNAVSKALFPSATASDMTNPESEFRKAHWSHDAILADRLHTVHAEMCR
ncbi:hypothetical protein HBI72_028520 [Parastagonospora nodorum]|nr:hypothetical protein HBI72_028520 [Parastagonospora nodorum]KAH6421996.1 hypothetical protein HBI59_228900 [Parastagonospora nodorum]